MAREGDGVAVERHCKLTIVIINDWACANAPAALSTFHTLFGFSMITPDATRKRFPVNKVIECHIVPSCGSFGIRVGGDDFSGKLSESGSFQAQWMIHEGETGGENMF